MGHSYANYIAKVALAPDNTDDESLVTAQYAGKRNALRPLYDVLIQTVSNAMFTHRVRITAKADIDSEFKRWLKQAYSEAGKP